MKWVIALLALLLIAVQYRLWVGEGSFAEVVTLQRQVADQQAELEAIKARNEALQAEVDSLKQDREAVEERARSELGMIRDGEVFFQVIEAPNAEDTGK